VQVMPETLSEEIRTFKQEHSHLMATARGKWALVHDSSVLGVFDSQMQAIEAGYAQLGNVPFLVRQVCRARRIHEMVSFGLVE